MPKDTAKIPLIKGEVALVDDADFQWLNQWKWWASKRKNTFYAYRTVGATKISMHRMILGFKKGDGLDVDHKNGLGWDNRRENLRVATRPQNNANNKHLSSRNTSGVLGVHWVKKKNRWCAQIGTNGRILHLGIFIQKEDAIAVRRQAEKHYFGDFAPDR